MNIPRGQEERRTAEQTGPRIAASISIGSPTGLRAPDQSSEDRIDTTWPGEDPVSVRSGTQNQMRRSSKRIGDEAERTRSKSPTRINHIATSKRRLHTLPSDESDVKEKMQSLAISRHFVI